MDPIVEAALKKWPNVPHCYGWLALDARGDWYMRDERIQAAGPFPRVKGSRINHEKLREFIERNYESDERGAWFFQNGPQRVYLQLEAAPWVWRLSGSGAPAETLIHSHTGRPAQLDSQTPAVWLDEADRLFLSCDLGLGLVHSLDMELAAEQVEAGLWEPVITTHDELVRRHGIRLDPKPSPSP
jgi:Protein of unknown function (DUF2946)